MRRSSVFPFSKISLSNTNHKVHNTVVSGKRNTLQWLKFMVTWLQSHFAQIAAPIEAFRMRACNSVSLWSVWPFTTPIIFITVFIIVLKSCPAKRHYGWRLIGNCWQLLKNDSVVVGSFIHDAWQTYKSLRKRDRASSCVMIEHNKWCHMRDIPWTQKLYIALIQFVHFKPVFIRKLVRVKMKYYKYMSENKRRCRNIWTHALQ